jgi:hypothetical protein
VYEGSFLPISSPASAFVCFFNGTILTRARQNLNVLLISISFMAKHFAMYLWTFVLPLRTICSIHFHLLVGLLAWCCDCVKGFVWLNSNTKLHNWLTESIYPKPFILKMRCSAPGWWPGWSGRSILTSGLCYSYLGLTFPPTPAPKGPVSRWPESNITPLLTTQCNVGTYTHRCLQTFQQTGGLVLGRRLHQPFPQTSRPHEHLQVGWERGPVGTLKHSRNPHVRCRVSFQGPPAFLSRALLLESQSSGLVVFTVWGLSSVWRPKTAVNQ